MKTDINQTNFACRMLTSFMRFTSLPVGKVFTPSAAYEVRAMEFWPLVGWLSGGSCAGAIMLLSPWLGLPVAVGIAMALRCCVLGMRNETGAAALFSTIVNRKTGQEGLERMEGYAFDATGALIAIVAWGALWWTLSTMDAPSAAITILAADTYTRMVSGQAIQFMPCATARIGSGTTPPYAKLSTMAGVVYFVVGIIPIAVLLWIGSGNLRWYLIIFGPCLVMYFMYLLTWRRFGGYTDKTIAAMQLAAELVCCAFVAMSV